MVKFQVYAHNNAHLYFISFCTADTPYTHKSGIPSGNRKIHILTDAYGWWRRIKKSFFFVCQVDWKTLLFFEFWIFNEWVGRYALSHLVFVILVIKIKLGIKKQIRRQQHHRYRWKWWKLIQKSFHRIKRRHAYPCMRLTLLFEIFGYMLDIL